MSRGPDDRREAPGAGLHARRALSRSLAGIVAVWAAFCLAAPAAAQQAQPPTLQRKPRDQQVVHISVTLVQVDAVVTDEAGRPVTDLTKDDFEILEDERPQAISNFLYVTAPAPKALPPPPESPGPPVRLDPDQVRRTIAIVVDDLKSVESARTTREAIRKFVDERMQPGDILAIVQARAGAGALQQFTADRQELYAAIDRIRYVPRFRAETNCDDAAAEDLGADKPVRPEKGAIDDALGTDVFVRGTLGVLGFVVGGLQNLPGRKAVVLLSDGHPCALGSADPRDTAEKRVRAAVENLVDRANRAAVSIYTVDVRGVTGLTSSPAVDGRDSLFRSRDVLSMLSQQTGGIFSYNTNDVAGAIRQAVDDQSGYYLLAYEPGESTFARKAGKLDFHRLTVRVKRPGLRVRSRMGFYAYSDEEAPPETRTPAQQMVDAVISPFAASGVRMQITPSFAYDQRDGPLVRCAIHIDARDLTFAPERDGTVKATLDTVVVAFGDNGGMVNRQAKTYEVRLKRDAYEKALRDGLEHVVTLPFKRSGAYQLRAAVRDVATSRVGSAYQFVELPDVRDGAFALSGVTLATEGARRYKPGDRVPYRFEVYNAERDHQTKRPSVEVSVRLYRDGRTVSSSDSKPLDLGQQPDLERLRIARDLELGPDLPPGQYVLEVVATDAVSKKRRTASQWVDFEVVGGT